jgi:predicted RNA-binding Zn-ribbon protein involved in translation (DUF1610 family)
MKRMEKPKLGDVKNSEDLGYRSRHKMVYHACEKCGEGRWVRATKGNQPASRHCDDCGLKVAADSEAEFRRGENREGKIREAWGDYCFTCGKKTKVLHRKDGQSHDNIRRMSATNFQKLYENDKERYVKLCERDHPRVHAIADDGWPWKDLEEFKKEVYEGGIK